MKNTIFTFKVSLKKDLYRIIEIKGNSPLSKLAEAITDSFDFDMDHAYGFYNNLKDPYTSTEAYTVFADMTDELDADENEKSVQNAVISDVFETKKKMIFLFDYGDEWLFLVECQELSPSLEKIKYPRVTKEVGKAPVQYPDYDQDSEVEE